MPAPNATAQNATRSDLTGLRAAPKLFPALALIAALHLFTFAAHAKYIGADPAPTQAVSPPMDASGTSISLTEGNLTDRQTLAVINPNGELTHGLVFSVTYNSYNADGSSAQIDTVMGNGWTHSFNLFLFNQLGSMFRYGSDGRVTKFRTAAGGTFVADTGYFETMVKNPDGSFTITQKDKTQWTYASIPGTPFLVGGPVFRLTQIKRLGFKSEVQHVENGSGKRRGWFWGNMVWRMRYELPTLKRNQALHHRGAACAGLERRGDRSGAGS